MNLATAEGDSPSGKFEPRLFGVGAWTDHLHFASDLVAAMKPRLIVELGTDRGESYFAFCQAAAENATGSRCYAIDTWRGDHQAGGYDEATFAEVAAHNAHHYATFSTLLQCSFDEVVGQFAAGSIDLLHIDGLHTEAAVRHDFETWLPKVRHGGVILLHDIGVRSGDFGVWKLWDELRGRGRSYAFAAGPGLGVWEKPPATRQPELLEALFAGGAAAEQLADGYRARASELHERIAQQWRDGSIRETAAARQTTIQIFHSTDGTHREEDSAFARIGHETWKEIEVPLPERAGAAPLRIDFLSAYTIVDIATITVFAGPTELFAARDAAAFSLVRIAGDAERIASREFLRLRVTGVDPQLYLPPLRAAGAGALRVALRLRVSRDAPPD